MNYYQYNKSVEIMPSFRIQCCPFIMLCLWHWPIGINCVINDLVALLLLSYRGNKTVHLQDNSQDMFLKTVQRRNCRQFTDTFEDNSATYLLYTD